MNSLDAKEPTLVGMDGVRANDVPIWTLERNFARYWKQNALPLLEQNIVPQENGDLKASRCHLIDRSSKFTPLTNLREVSAKFGITCE